MRTIRAPSRCLPISPAGEVEMSLLGIEFVALRVWRSDSYVHADENGRSVYHGIVGGDGDLPNNAVWTVEELVAGEPLTRYVLFRGAYGRYLGAPEAQDGSALQVVQRDRDALEVDGIMWWAIACSGHDLFQGVLLRDRLQRFLRSNNRRFLARRQGVSVDGNIGDERTLRWEVVPVRRPECPIGTYSELGCSPALQPEIRFLLCMATSRCRAYLSGPSRQVRNPTRQSLRPDLSSDLTVPLTASPNTAAAKEAS
uniref:DUF569 domain-containing protein n=1 Tax=Leersia perrieri TaxID=77586 RepID=A0A0D9WW10_9ORYZ